MVRPAVDARFGNDNSILTVLICVHSFSHYGGVSVHAEYSHEVVCRRLIPPVL